MPEPTDGDRKVRPFAAVIQDLDHGKVHAAASSALVELVDAVIAQGKKGYLTLRLDLKPAGTGVTDSLIVTGQITVKAPDADPGSSVFFLDSDGCLIRNNPAYEERTLIEVPTPPAAERPIRHINGEIQ